DAHRPRAARQLAIAGTPRAKPSWVSMSIFSARRVSPGEITRGSAPLARQPGTTRWCARAPRRAMWSHGGRGAVARGPRREVPVADHRERLAAEQLPHEDRDHAADIQAVEPRTVDVEVAQDRHGETEPAVGQTEMLAGGLRRGVTPTVDRAWTQDPIGVLRPRDRRVAAIDLGGRSEHDPASMLERGAQHVLRAVDVHVQYLV